MAEPENNPERVAGAPAQDAADAQVPQPRPQIEVDDSQAKCCYANFCRVTGTPEELIINPQPVGAPTEPISVTQRIITNLYTAKRMLRLLELTVQRHEAAFGALEIDVQKRIGRRNA
jgi:hypothetical protein